MNHAHDYHIVADLVLSLPDHTGLYDRLLQFQCACGQYTVVHGSFHVESRGVTLDELVTQSGLERQAGGALARIAQREEEHRITQKRKRYAHTQS